MTLPQESMRALHVSPPMGRVGCARALLRWGADLEAPGSVVRTRRPRLSMAWPLRFPCALFALEVSKHCAALKNWVACLRSCCFLFSGKSRRTPLHFATIRSQVSTLHTWEARISLLHGIRLLLVLHEAS